MRTADADETHSHHVLLTKVPVAPSNAPSETVDFRREMVGQTTWAGARPGWARLGQAGPGWAGWEIFKRPAVNFQSISRFHACE